MARDPDRSKPDGLHWGDYDAAGDLPNASGSAIQTQILDYGDVASVAGILYSCTDPRENGATWTITGGGGTVTGTGTDNRVVRWDGTAAIQDSSVEISDVGEMELKGSQPRLRLNPSAAGSYTELNYNTVPFTITVAESGVDALSVSFDPSEATDALPSVYPEEDSAYDLGSTTKLWKTIRGDNLYASTQISLQTELAVTRFGFNFTPISGTAGTASQLRSQDGSSVGAGVNGHPGGDLTIRAGDGSGGGTGGANTNGGPGGDLALRAGNGSEGFGEGSDAVSGNVTIDAGDHPASASLDGTITIGGTAASEVNIGNANSQVGFYGVTAATRPNVTGSTGANAALQSLLTALETLGLITDSTT